MPTAIADAAVGPAQLLIVGATFAIMDGSALALYARAGGGLRAFRARHGRSPWEGRMAGGSLLAAAIVLACRADH